MDFVWLDGTNPDSKTALYNTVSIMTAARDPARRTEVRCGVAVIAHDLGHGWRTKLARIVA